MRYKYHAIHAHVDPSILEICFRLTLYGFEFHRSWEETAPDKQEEETQEEAERDFMLGHLGQLLRPQ